MGRAAVRLVLAATASVAALLAAPAAVAGALRVSPVRVDVPAGKQFGSITVTNDGDEPVSIQVRGFRWDQDDTGADVLATGSIQVNPPLFTLRPRQSELVRLAVDAGGQSAQESAWRLLIDELPAPDEAIVPGVIKARLRISLPVFRTPRGARPMLTWHEEHSGDGRRQIVIANSGTAHTRIASLSLNARTGGAPVIFPRAFYLLPGRSGAFPVDAAIGSVEAKTGEGAVRLAQAAPAAAQ